MIEEFMLLGNIAVAEKIAFNYPTFAIMRRHPRPKDKEIKEYRVEMNNYKTEISELRKELRNMDQRRWWKF